MVGSRLHITAVDPKTGEIAWHCAGPDARGACGRVAIGEEMPCIGKALSVEGGSAQPYVVPDHLTLCPVTLALALGITLGEPAREEAHAA